MRLREIDEMSSEQVSDQLTAAIREYNEVRECEDKGTLCHALENSLYFARDGSVMACCYSREQPVGRYPEQSISEIWHGAKAASMRSALRRNELPAGCELCADELLARNFRGLLAASFDYKAAERKLVIPISEVAIGDAANRNYPTQLEFELSNTCNLECAMCSGTFSSTIRAKREKLPPLPQVYDKNFVDQLEPFMPHLRNCNFVGGEPFLIDIYFDIWERLSVLNPQCRIAITTNGTVYNSKVQRVLETLNCFITVSLDSVVKPTYESIRVNAKMERTLANVEKFFASNKRRGRTPAIAVCPMVSNCREMPDLVAFANSHGAQVNFNNVVFPVEQSLRALKPDIAREVIQQYRQANLAPKTEIEAANQAGLVDVANQIDYWTDQNERECEERNRFVSLASAIEPGERDSAAWAAVLADLKREANRWPGEGSEVMEDPSPSVTAAAYCTAMMVIGSGLARRGDLTGVSFDMTELEKFIGFLNHDITPQQNTAVLRSLRQSPRNVMQYAGSASSEQLINGTLTYLESDLTR